MLPLLIFGLWLRDDAANGTFTVKDGKAHFPATKHNDGKANFKSVGKIAAPVSYLSFFVHVDVRKTLNDARREIREAETFLTKVNASLVDNHNWTVEEAEKLISVYLPELSEAIGGADRSTQTLSRTFEGLLAEDHDVRSFPEFFSVVGTIFNFGSNLLTREEMGRLAKQVKREGRVISRLSMAVKALADENAKEMRHLREAAAIAVAVARLANRARDIEQELKDVDRSVIRLVQHQLDPIFLTPDVLERLGNEERAFASRTNSFSLVKGAAETIDLPVSYVIGADGMVAIIHLPFVQSRDDLRNLYRLHSTIINHKNDLVAFHADETYIAVTAKGDRHSALTQAELGDCQKHGVQYYCTDHGLTEKKPTTCIGALYYAETSLATRLCYLSRFGNLRPVFQLNQTAFLIAKDTKVNLACPGDQLQIFPAEKEQRIVDVAAGCVLHNEAFEARTPILTTEKHFSVDQGWWSRPFSLPAPSSTPFDSHDKRSNRTTAAAEETEDMMKALDEELAYDDYVGRNFTSRLDEELEEEAEEAEDAAYEASRIGDNTLYYYIAAASVGATLLVVGFGCCVFWCFRRASPAATAVAKDLAAAELGPEALFIAAAAGSADEPKVEVRPNAHPDVDALHKILDEGLEANSKSTGSMKTKSGKTLQFVHLDNDMYAVRAKRVASSQPMGGGCEVPDPDEDERVADLNNCIDRDDGNISVGESIISGSREEE